MSFRKTERSKTVFKKSDGGLIRPIVSFKGPRGEIAHIVIDNNCYVVCIETAHPMLDIPMAEPLPMITTEILKELKSLPYLTPEYVENSDSKNPKQLKIRFAKTLESLLEGSPDADSVEAALYIHLTEGEKRLLNTIAIHGPSTFQEFSVEDKQGLLELRLIAEISINLDSGYLALTDLGRRVYRSRVEQTS